MEREYHVVAIDLTGEKKNPVSSIHRLQPAHPVGEDHLNQAFGYYEYIELENGTLPVLWGNKELKDRLLQAEGVDCSKSEIRNILYDHQDSRVLYLYCKRKEIAYRIELPSMNAVAIPLGAVAGLPSDDMPGFFSAPGQKKIFVNVNRGAYEIEVGSNNKATKIENIEYDSYGPKRRSAKSLIGVADGLRIYQLTQLQEKTAQLSIEYDQQAPRVYSLPAVFATKGANQAVYLPRNNLVLWEVMGEVAHKTVIYSLSLDSGAMRRAEVKIVE